MTYGTGKSDRLVVPEKAANKPGRPGAEGLEGRGLAKGNPQERTASRTQGRTRTLGALERVRQPARKDRKQRFTALYHHVYAIDGLRGAFYGLERRAAPGIAAVTWRRHEKDLETNLRDLSARLRQGAYRASPARRAYVPKGEGKRRPIGVVTLEDKLVQRAVAEVLHVVYEVDLLGFSYGFRPGRGPHDALDALSVALVTTKVNWVLDADIRAIGPPSSRWTPGFACACAASCASGPRDKVADKVGITRAGPMPSLRRGGCSPWSQPTKPSASPAAETTDRRAGCVMWRSQLCGEETGNPRPDRVVASFFTT